MAGTASAGSSPHLNCCNAGASWEGSCHSPHDWRVGGKICRTTDEKKAAAEKKLARRPGVPKLIKRANQPAETTLQKLRRLYNTIKVQLVPRVRLPFPS